MEADPKLGADHQLGLRYNAACAAALASAGQGKDDPPFDDVAKAKLRGQALGWLKDEREVQANLSDPGTYQVRWDVARTLLHWREDPDLAGAREPQALARLPEAERKEWQSLWAEVSSLLESLPLPTKVKQTCVFNGHSNVVWKVAFSRDGKRMLSVSHDGLVILWDAKTGRRIKQLHGHTDHVKAVAFLADGRQAISGGDDDTLILWDLATGREVRRFLGHTADVESLAMSPDGARVISAAGDKTVRSWDIATGRQIMVCNGHPDGVTRVDWLPDGLRAISISNDGTVRLWDMESGKELRYFDAKAGHANSLTVSPDGRTALVGYDDDVIRIWEIDTGHQIGELLGHHDAVSCVVFTPDGGRAISGISGGADHFMRIWDLKTCKEVRSLDVGEGIFCIAIAPDAGSFIVGVGRSPRLLVLPPP